MPNRDYLHSEDKLLIDWTVGGDSLAYGEIVRRYETMVAKTVIGMVGDIQQADDVGQDTFIRLYKSLSDFRGESRLSTYIQRIAINLSLNELKRKRRFVSVFSRIGNDLQESEREFPETNNTEEDMDLREILSRSIGRLPQEFKSVVVLRLVQGYSTKETAEILELPLGTILSRLSRAREQLRLEINSLM